MRLSLTPLQQVALLVFIMVTNAVVIAYLLGRSLS